MQRAYGRDGDNTDTSDVSARHQAQDLGDWEPRIPVKHCYLFVLLIFLSPSTLTCPAEDQALGQVDFWSD